MTLKASPGRAVEKTFLEGQAVLNPKNAGGVRARTGREDAPPGTGLASPRVPACTGLGGEGHSDSPGGEGGGASGKLTPGSWKEVGGQGKG